MSTRVSISPLTRVEGHLGIKVDVESNRVSRAFVAGEMFRGFEVILRGREPLDAQHITQRICGVCSVEHGMASILAQEMAFKAAVPDNARIARNLILAANFLASHITHFYLLSGPDFADVAMIESYQGNDRALLDLKAWVKSQMDSKSVLPAAPLLPRYTAQYLQDREANFGLLRHYLDALEMRSLAQKIAAEFAGKMPHASSLVAGGITDRISARKLAAYRDGLLQILDFIREAYLPDVAAAAKAFPEYFSVGRGNENFLAYGAFPEAQGNSAKLMPGGVLMDDALQTLDPEAITEDVAKSYFSSASRRKPYDGETVAAPDKAEAYSWLKAPRYQGKPMEVGPLARVLVAYRQPGTTALKTAVDGLLKTLGRQPRDLVSVMGRHAARALESQLLAERCLAWLDQLDPGAPAFTDFETPDSARGFGLTEAARGALGHWLETKDGKIANYQCVVPTTWNCSPQDDQGQAGPLEQALVGTPIADPANPIEAARVVRSFDPCLACAVH
jgi:ferredoxin hydrogenase large subunit/hydrogenase large subunit